MAKEHAPAFQFYVRDWLASGSVAILSLEERGAYITLLARCWLMVELPLDGEELASLAGASGRWWDKHGERVLRQFTRTETGYRNTRLDDERSKQVAYRNKQSGRAVAGWETRHGNATATPRQCPDDALLSASSSSSSSASAKDKKEPSALDLTVEFRTAWDAHPSTPKVREWTAQRIATILRRQREGRDLMAVVRAFDDSAFLAGTKGRGEGHESFRATVDWCLKPANLIKILEGAYADPAAALSPVTRGSLPEYGCDWCDHHPRCASPELHAIKVKVETRRGAEL